MAKSRGPVTPTKKHLARVERERIQQRYLLIGTILVTVAVVGVLLYGVLRQQVFLPNQSVAQVGDESIKLSEFQSRVRYERNQLVSQYVNTYQTMELFGTDNPDLTLNFQNQMQQILFQLDPSSMGREVLNTMIDEKIIRNEAEKLGIVVTDEDVQERIEQEFGYLPDGPLPTNTPFPTPGPTSTLSSEQLALVTPVPTATNVPSTTPDPSATPTETPAPTATVEPTASPTPYTIESFRSDYQNAVQAFRDNIQFDEENLRDLIRNQIYRERLYEILTADLPTTQEQVWARHILVEDIATAQQVQTLLSSGGDFTELATQFSTDPGSKDSGGDLGWFSPGQMLPEFEQAAFNLQIGQISEPVQSQFGYHIIQVLGKEARALSQSQYQQAAQQVVDDWLVGKRAETDTEIFDIWAENVPSEPSVPENLLIQQ